MLSYTNPSGGSSSYTVKYTAKTVQTAFGCSGISEYGATLQNLVTGIALPDGSSYSFKYEATPGYPSNVTGRLASVTLPTGGIISYTYTSGSNGITCSDGTAATLNRTTPDSSTAWVYAHSESGCASGSAWCTTITDPSANQTVISVQPAAPTGGQVNGYEVQRKVNQGASTLLQTVDTCYNGASPPCLTAAIGTFPFSQVTTRTTPAGYTLQAYKTTYYTNGLPTEVDEYDYGNAAQGGLLRKTTTAYATYLTNNIVDMPATVSVYTGGGTLVAQTTYTYDENNTLTTTTGTPQHGSVTGSRGNATTVTFLTAGTTYLTQHSTYYDTGNVNVFTDANGGQTTYAYGSGTSCGNSFVTGVTEAVTSLTRSYAWNCTGGVMTSTADENGQIWQTGYASPADPNYWRPTSTTDPASATTTLCYWPDGPSGCATHTGYLARRAR